MNRLLELLIVIGLIFVLALALIGVSKTEPVKYRDVRHQIESEAMIL